MKTRSILILCFLCLLSIRTSSAQVANCDQGTASETLSANEVHLEVNNSGWPIQSEYFVPRSAQASVLAGLGIWLSGKSDTEYRSAVSTSQNSEWWPGTVEGIRTSGNCTSEDRLFRLTREDLSLLVNGQDTSQSIRDWPWHLGAPVIDGDGVADNYNIRGGDIPQIRGDEMVWWVMNDQGNIHRLSQSQSLGVEIRVSVMAIKSFDTLNETVFMGFELTNTNESPVDSVFFGIHMDAALGNPYDNYFGTDPEAAMSYFYNADDDDDDFLSDDEAWTGYGNSPPAFGLMALEGPRIDDDGIDNDFDGSVDEEGERLSHFRSFANPFSEVDCSDGSCFTSPDAVNLHLRGRDGSGVLYQDACLMWGGRCNTPDFFWSFPGNPPDFWSEMNTDDAGSPSVAGQRSSMNVFGPFTLFPREKKKTLWALVWARGSDHLDSVRELRNRARYIRGGYQGGLLLNPIFPTDSQVELPQSNRQITVFPNPSTGIFNLENQIEMHDKHVIRVFDFSGRLLEQFHHISYSQVDLSKKSAGIYLLEIESKEGVSHQMVFKI